MTVWVVNDWLRITGGTVSASICTSGGTCERWVNMDLEVTVSYFWIKNISVGYYINDILYCRIEKWLLSGCYACYIIQYKNEHHLLKLFYIYEINAIYAKTFWLYKKKKKNETDNKFNLLSRTI